MNCSLIFGDNFFGNSARLGIGRSTGAHRAATLFRKYNFDVEVIDFFSDYTLDEIKKIINLYQKEHLKFIGFSASLFNYEKKIITEIISFIRKEYPTTKIIAGGTNSFLKGISKADLYIEGFIEGAIGEIVNWILDKPNSLIIESLNNCSIVNCTKNYPLYDLKNLETVYHYSDFLDKNETLVLEFARGCIFKCKFCDYPLIGKNKNDYIRDESEILKEIESNYKNFGTTRYIIADDTFNDNEIKVDILHRISKKINFKLEIMGFIRADLLNARPGSLEKLIDSGFKAVHFGIETFNQKSSVTIGKGFNGKKLKEYLKIIKDKFPNFRIHGSFILGLPYESLEEFEQGIFWCHESQLVDSWSIYPLTIPVDNNFSFNSYFSKNWMMYGYQKIFILNSSIIAWKNSHTNYFEALNKSKIIEKKYTKNKKLNPWAVFSLSPLGFDIEELLSKKINEINTENIIVKTKEFVNNYKSKKYNFILSKKSNNI